MQKKDLKKYYITIVAGISFIIKLILVFKYKNLLTLYSDDLNYVKSAVALLKNGTLTFHNFNEPTVFIMPLYPAFLAGVFKVFGYGLAGIQAVRVIQAVFSCVTIILVFYIGKYYFNEKVAAVSAFLVAFYFPNIVTVGYMLTETLFSTLLCLLMYLSLIYSQKPGDYKFFILGIVWTLATLCRPTIALYPILLFFYIIVYLKMSIVKVMRYGLIMLAVFIIIMLPWWVRNYREYGEFIPLAASGGNPMLQGTYVNYEQTPGNIVYYRLGKNAFETNKSEVEVAKKRIEVELKKDFWGYLKWFVVGKTKLLWNTVFYWKPFLNIKWTWVLASHYVIIAGFFGILSLIFSKVLRYILPISILLYFNAVHCVYMAFDRYAFPLLPILSIFSAYSLYSIYSLFKSAVLATVKGEY